MATCKDCIHYDVCFIVNQSGDGRVLKNSPCKYFKDNSLVLDLPCKVGDKIYQLDTAGNIYESEITKIIYDTNGIAFDSKAIGKCVFFSREAAEQALKEREQV